MDSGRGEERVHVVRNATSHLNQGWAVSDSRSKQRAVGRFGIWKMGCITDKGHTKHKSATSGIHRQSRIHAVQNTSQYPTETRIPKCRPTACHITSSCSPCAISSLPYPPSTSPLKVCEARLLSELCLTRSRFSMRFNSLIHSFSPSL